MCLLRYISSALLAVALAISCGNVNILKSAQAQVLYHIHAEKPTSVEDVKMADYLGRHLQRRSEAILLDRDGIDVTLHVGDDFGGDFSFSRENGGYQLKARDERTMIWLVYQFIKMASRQDSGIDASDLPPLLLSGRDTVVTFPFEYMDIYTPVNQNPDFTQIMGIHNLEGDWGLWGHNLSRVLGSNGDKSFGYQNMDQELFARGADGVVHQNQFCFSSEKLLELTEKYILDQYGDGSEHPTRITIGPADNSWVCMCRRCEMAGNTKTSATPAVVMFVERLAAKFPGHTFFIPGYSTTAALPSRRLPSNVGVFLSAIDYPRALGDKSAAKKDAFFRHMDDWRAKTDNIYIWDYISNFDDYLTPFPVLNVMQDRFREYRKRGVKGVFLNGSGYFYSMHQEMYSFVLASLLLNPDADIPSLVKAYHTDAMPHIGPFFSLVVLSMEEEVRKRMNELPMYGGMEDAIDSYFDERGFREFYSVFLRAEQMDMTHRERVLYEKTRQFISFTFLELCRKNGLGAGGFAERMGDEWIVKPEVWAAVEDLKLMTPEDDLWILTGMENASMDQMDRVNEQGVYVADYENEVELWLASGAWNGDRLLQRSLTVKHDGGRETVSRLTDGVIGISQNYHWGWNVFPQKDLVVELPADALAGNSGELTVGFLHCERHRISPPFAIEVWVDGVNLGALRREGLADYVDEGERVVFRGNYAFASPSRVELRVVPSNTRDLAIDEVSFK